MPAKPGDLLGLSISLETRAKDIGYPSTVALDKKGTLLTAFYADYESTFKKKPNLYRVLTMSWSLKDWLHPTILGSISDGKQLKL